MPHRIGRLFGLRVFVSCTFLLVNLCDVSLCESSRRLHEIRRTVEIEKATLSIVAERLSRSYDVPVCVEVISEDEQVTVRAKKCTLAETLDAFVSGYPAYCWTYDTTNDMVNVYPSSNAVTETVMETQPQTTTLNGLLSDGEDTCRLKDRGIDLAFHASRSDIGGRDIVLPGGLVRIRDLVNKVCTQMSGRWRWTMMPARSGAIFWEEAKRPVKYSLWLIRYRPFGAKTFDWQERLMKVRAYSNQIAEGKKMHSGDENDLRRCLCNIYDDEILQVEPDERQAIATDLMGTNTYKILEAHFQEILRSSTSGEKSLAIRCLSAGLFSIGSAEKIRAFSKVEDRDVQSACIEGLLYLGESGNLDILKQYVSAGSLSRAAELDALKMIKLRDKKMCESLLLSIFSRRKPAVTESSQDYLEILKDVNTNAFAKVVEECFLGKGMQDRYILSAILDCWSLVEKKEEVLRQAEAVVAARSEDGYIPAATMLAQYGGEKEEEFLKTQVSRKDLSEQELNMISIALKVVETRRQQAGKIGFH